MDLYQTHGGRLRLCLGRPKRTERRMSTGLALSDLVGPCTALFKAFLEFLGLSKSGVYAMVA